VKTHQKPHLRVIDCRKPLPKPAADQDTVSVLRVLLAKALTGEVAALACCYYGDSENGTVLTGAFRSEPERFMPEALRVSAERMLSAEH
jgi:hypothetical protein